MTTTLMAIHLACAIVCNNAITIHLCLKYTYSGAYWRDTVYVQNINILMFGCALASHVWLCGITPPPFEPQHPIYTRKRINWDS